MNLCPRTFASVRKFRPIRKKHDGIALASFSCILSFLCFLLFFRLSQACCYENCTTRYVIFPQNSRSNRRLFLTSRSVETRTSVVEGLKAALDVHADLISVRQLPRHPHPHHSSLSSSSSSTISDLTHHTT